MMQTHNTGIPVVAFAGGGTGGHIYPGLAIIGALKEDNTLPCPRVFWIGDRSGVDGSLVKSFDVQFFGIHSGKLRRYISIKNISDIFKIIAGFFESVHIFKKEKPCLLFSKGGFVSVPPVIAAYILGIPVWTHESDFSPGLATKINAIFAQKIYVSFSNTVHFFRKNMRKKITVTGNPVRSAFYQADAARGRRFAGAPDGEPILLALGGSQGAREINELVRAALSELCRRFIVVHQTGGFLAEERNVDGTSAAGHTGGDDTEERYIAEGRYVQVSYIKDEMPDVLAAAALIVGRSGAGSVWECAAAGKPMVLVPLSGSGTRGDQVENARCFAEKGAAVCLIRPDKAALAAAIDRITAGGALAAMSEASRKAGMVHAAKTIAAFIGELCRG